jgi:hypothetical protein
MKIPILERPKGIVINCPYKQVLKDKIVKVTIYYYSRKPSSISLECIQPHSLLTEIEGLMTEEGIVFVYKAELERGFYRIVITSSNGMKGEGLYPLLHNQQCLIIGLPYSAYSTVDLQ